MSIRMLRMITVATCCDRGNWKVAKLKTAIFEPEKCNFWDRNRNHLGNGRSISVEAYAGYLRKRRSKRAIMQFMPTKLFEETKESPPCGDGYYRSFMECFCCTACLPKPSCTSRRHMDSSAVFLHLVRPFEHRREPHIPALP